MSRPHLLSSADAVGIPCASGHRRQGQDMCHADCPPAPWHGHNPTEVLAGVSPSSPRQPVTQPEQLRTVDVEVSKKSLSSPVPVPASHSVNTTEARWSEGRERKGSTWLP